MTNHEKYGVITPRSFDIQEEKGTVVMGDLSVRDLTNLAHYFPPETKSGLAAWAVAGGGAIKCLATAERLFDLQRKTGVSYEPRGHKDLDVYAFDPTGCRLPRWLPHEIYRTEFFSKPKRCDYRDREPVHTGFYYEVLHGSFFGYGPPKREDAVRVELMGRFFWTLRPEYVIATRRFHALPERSRDKEDLAYLASVFHLDLERLRRMIGYGPLCHLINDPAFSDYVLHETLHPADGGQLVEVLARREVGQRFPFLTEFPLQREELRLFLLLDPAWLSVKHFEQAYAEAETILKGVHGAPSLRAAVALTLCAFDEHDRGSRGTMKVIQESRWVTHNSDMFLRMAVQFLRGIRKLKASDMIAPEDYPVLLQRIFREFYKTAFVHVFLSALDGLPAQLRRARGEDGLGTAFAPFAALLGMRTVGKRVYA